MSKRGRKPLDPVSVSVIMTIRVPATLADAMFILAQRKGTNVSAITRRFYERQAQRISSYTACESDQKDARLTA